MSSEKRVYKLNISGGNTGSGKGLSKLVQIDEKKFRFEGLKIGDVIKGGFIGFPNYEFQITGGSDTSGFPIRKDVHGPVKKKILVSKYALINPRSPCRPFFLILLQILKFRYRIFFSSHFSSNHSIFSW